MSHYKENIAWRHSFELGKKVYQMTDGFPLNQRFSLSDQMQRSAVSISSNIAEGWARSAKDWRRFMIMAYGSASELETQLLLAKELNFINEQSFSLASDHLKHILRILNHYIYKKRAVPSVRTNPDTDD